MAKLINRTKHVRQQNLPAARTRTSLARVLGLGRQESLTPHTRDVHSVRRNEATFGKFMVHQTAAFERKPSHCATHHELRVNSALADIVVPMLSTRLHAGALIQDNHSKFALKAG